MCKYSEIAIRAVAVIKQSKKDPKCAWNALTKGNSKGCAKAAFLGLCESGVIKGVPSGKYTSSVKNKGYALSAISFLKDDPSLANDKRRLWKRCDGPKNHASQMDVVIGLWNAGLII